MKAYKIVEKYVDGEFMSLATYGEHNTNYVVGGWVSAPVVGKLFVFGRLEDAREFEDYINGGGHDERIQVWECEVEDCEPAPRKIPAWQSMFAQWWGAIADGVECAGDLLIVTPQGTMLAQRVMLTKRVE